MRAEYATICPVSRASDFAPAAATAESRAQRLETLYARWEQFSGEYTAAQARNDQELMTNLRGLMLLIKRDIERRGGQLPDFPYSDEHHLADL